MQDKKSLLDQTKMIDFEMASQTFEGDWEMFSFALKIFDENYGDPIELIQKSLDTNDPKEIHRAMHSFKGALKQVGAKSLSEKFLKIEEFAKNGDIDQAKSGFEEAKSDILDLSQDIKNIRNS